MAGQPIELVELCALPRLQAMRAGALLDFWQADAKGHYDNSGFRLRGHQFADAGRALTDCAASCPAPIPAAPATSM